MGGQCIRLRVPQVTRPATGAEEAALRIARLLVSARAGKRRGEQR
jgi:hypothetical protein